MGRASAFCVSTRIKKAPGDGDTPPSAGPKDSLRNFWLIKVNQRSASHGLQTINGLPRPTPRHRLLGDALVLISAITGEKRRLVYKPATVDADLSPSFSPNGRYLAFTRHLGPHNGDISAFSNFRNVVSSQARPDDSRLGIEWLEIRSGRVTART